MNLCLSLGHNSSAVLVDHEGYILIGYENERLSGIKSDSAFPIQAIDEIGKYYNLAEVMHVYVSHWSTFGKVDEMSAKHWRPDLVNDRCPYAGIHGDIDHHDCHVRALRAFTSGVTKWEIVADGFGNFNETMSIYYKGSLVRRAFGFDKSLGLLYQYATAFLGMKMNQDEYKLLGFESHIKECASPALIQSIQKSAEKTARLMFNSIIESTIKPEYDAVAGLDALPNLKLKVHDHLKSMTSSKWLHPHDKNPDRKKVVTAFYVQSIIESVMVKVIDHYCMDEVALTGGIFMNVKLNNAIAKRVNKISIMPICGDQSCGLGAYNYHRGNLVWPDHLFWSERGGVLTLDDNDLDMVVFDYEDDALEYIGLALNSDRIVNLVKGKGEFGARALGNTTTLALPSAKNVEYINHVNNRSTVMPMAGMVSKEFMLDNYIGSEKVHKSLEYMIMTLDAKSDMTLFRGCHHNHPLTDVMTNRVQLVDNDSMIGELVKNFGCIINTSFNIHGEPIVLTGAQVQKSHDYQKGLDVEDRVTTVIIRN